MQTSNANPIGILAIQGDFSAHQRTLADLQVPTRLVKKSEQLENLAGLILPGGESTTLLKFLDNEALWEPLKAFAASKPVFGTCAGAILMARRVENPDQKCLGIMDISIRRNAFGRQVYSFIRHASVGKQLAEVLGPANVPGEGKLEAVFIRAPLILETGPEVGTLITLDGSPVLVQQGQHLAATFHPELSAAGGINAAGAYVIHRYFCKLALGCAPEINSQAG